MDSRANSALLYDILEMVGVSEDVRFRRRNVLISEIINNVIENLRTEKTNDTYTFGSYSECTTVRGIGSDIDIVQCFKNFDISLEITETVTDLKDWTPRFFLDPKTNPGYAKVKPLFKGNPLPSKEYPETNGKLLLDDDGIVCFSNLLGKVDNVRHGPAFSGSDKIGEYDYVRAFMWTDFPDTLKQWLAPDRQHTWRDDVLERCRVLPLLLVPVGHSFSKEKDIEWRISYSFHERELMFSLNPSQHKCYVTLKMMKKDIMEPDVGEDCISSYHLKTCLFWAIEHTREIEHTQNALWTRDSLFECVSLCLWYLMYFVLTGNCPNYFLPDVNLFQRLNFSQVQDSLLAKLKTVITNLLFSIKLLRCADVGMCFADQNTTGIQSTEKILVESECHFVLISAWLLWNRTIQHMCCACESRERIIERLRETLDCLKLVREHPDSLTCEAIDIMISRLKFQRNVCLAAKAVSAKEDFDGHLTHLNELATVSGHDLLTPRLMIVTLLYKLERYVECENVLRQIDKDLNEYVLSCCVCKEIARDKFESHFKKFSLAANPDAMASLASATATCISFVPADRDLVPEPLLEEMGRYRHRKSDEAIPKDPLQDDCLRVDGKVYFYLMKYLVCSHLKKPTERCLNEMRTLIDTDVHLNHKGEANKVYDWMNKTILKY